MTRARWSILLAVAGLLLAALLLLMGVEPLHALPMPILAFGALAVAVLFPRYSERRIRGLAMVIAVLLVVPHVWWYAEYGGNNYDGGGVNFALGCAIVALPFVLASVLFFGLLLPARDSR